MFNPRDIHREIYDARQRYEQKIEQIEDEEIFELSQRFHISEELARQIWEQSV